MAYIKFLRYAASTDFNVSMNKELKPPVALAGGIGLTPLIKGRGIDSVVWLGANEQQINLLSLILNDGSSILINQGADGAPQVIHLPPSKN